MKYKVRVPTNIALLKYWGKSDEKKQWPANDSLSMSLDLYTETVCSLHHFENKEGTLYFQSDQETGTTPAFLHKALEHLRFLSNSLGFKDSLYIQTHNEFPAGCGIASSASGLGAITLAALACWTNSSSFEDLEKKGFTRERISKLARLGSGSASRSLWGGFVHWQRGENPESQKCEPLLDAEHWNLRDCIVILSEQEKTISSSEGHRYAHTSPLFEPRLAKIPQRLEYLKKSIENKQLAHMGALIEEEALEMHEIMASSNPPCVYMTASSFDFLTFLAKTRNETKLPMFFTMDAGPNVHVIYEEKNREKVLEILKNYQTIDVGISSGPVLSRESYV